MAEKYYSVSLYAYCKNDPVNMFDLDGKDGILIVFPDYKITVGSAKIPYFGHAGVLLINNETGLTKYYEYGRYDDEGKGIVRNVPVPNVIIDPSGKPTKESLQRTLSSVSRANHNNKIEGAYVTSDDFEAMNDYAQMRLNDNTNNNRESYPLWQNNCGTFAAETLGAGDDVEIPKRLRPRPNSLLKQFLQLFDPIEYDPQTE